MKKYEIVLTCNDYNVKIEPYLDKVDKLFDSKELAEIECQVLGKEECLELNQGRKSKDFKFDEDGSQEFDYVTRFWDGPDYRVVTGYQVKEIQVIQKTVYVLLLDWVNKFEAGVQILGTFNSFEEAHIKMAEQFELEIKNFSKGDIHEENNSLECYVEGGYDENHVSIWIETQVVDIKLTPEEEREVFYKVDKESKLEDIAQRIENADTPNNSILNGLSSCEIIKDETLMGKIFEIFDGLEIEDYWYQMDNAIKEVTHQSD